MSRMEVIVVARLVVHSFAMSIDGYSAGPSQDLQNPLGINGPELMDWLHPTRIWRKIHGQSDGETGVDNAIVEQGFGRFGAWIMGRNMFGPVRGPWPDGSWRGWWGESPPFRVPTFVLTHHPRRSIKMVGGTEFHFVTGGIHAALERATAAAGERDIRIGGGVSTIRQYLQESLIDELHLAVRPILLGKGENLFEELDMRALGYVCARSTNGERATHVLIRRRPEHV
jgi:dihydrofolate reductase